MTVTLKQSEAGKVRLGPGWGVVGWLLGIFGAISLFVGLFVMFGSADSSIGIGGDLSWQVGEISDAWMYGLLIGGGLAVVLALGIMLFGPRHEMTPSSGFSELMWHLGAFLVVNAFVWTQDAVIGGGIDYAYWLTIPWGIGLAIHALTFYLGRRPGQFGQPQPH